MGRGLPCDEFEPSTTKDPPCSRAPCRVISLPRGRAPQFEKQCVKSLMKDRFTDGDRIYQVGQKMTGTSGSKVMKTEMYTIDLGSLWGMGPLSLDSLRTIDGWLTRRVAGQVDRSECAVRNCCEQWTREGTHAQKTGSGATRKTTRRDDRRIVRQALVDPTVTR
ncbi:uncharacterized protein TNCV_4195261 [Trichonephila clavipes]|nr:uncharacterized protein TNCV_4195261 [Trichonephila clavipes]